MGVFLCPFDLDLFPRLPYNVGMKDKELKIKVDEQFIEKVDYLQRINDFKNRSDCVRKVVEKEWRKENGCIKCRFAFQQRDSEDSWHPVCGISHKNLTAHDLGWNPDDCPLRKEKEDGKETTNVHI